MSDYTKKAEEFLIEQGYPNRGIKTVHKLGGSYIVDLAHVLTQYEEYLEGLCAREHQDDMENVDEALRNAGSLC